MKQASQGKNWRPAVVLAVLGTLACPVFTVAQPEAPAKKVDLRPHFEQGRTARYKFWTTRRLTQATTFGAKSRSVDTQFQVDGELTWTVQSVNPDGTATCVMTIHWITGEHTMPDGTVQTNDSRKGDGDIEPVHRVLVATVGVPLTFEVSADGTVNNVTGTEAIRSAAGEGVRVPEDLDFIESATDLAVIAAAPAEIEPEGDWDVDFTWTHDLGRINHQMKYTLRSIDDVAGIPVAIVGGEASLRIEVDNSKFPSQGPQPDIQLTGGSVKTQIMFDLSRHEAVGRNTVETRTIEISVEFGGQSVSTVSNEKIHSQILRIAEEG